jgi:phosphoglycolate phosphatase-like HAD superfamily hydrolase
MLDKSKRVLIFDWDGTLFDSMPIKYRTFSEVVASYLSPRNQQINVQKVRDLYKQYSGEPRIVIFNKIAGYYGLELDSKDTDKMSELLSARNAQELLTAKLFTDAEMLLSKLKELSYRLYISSSVPTEELQLLVKHAVSPDILTKISGIFGSSQGFSKGIEHMEYICAQENCGREACIMFGDDEADMRLSLAAGIASKLVDRSGRYINSNWQKINSFEEIIACL